MSHLLKKNKSILIFFRYIISFLIIFIFGFVLLCYDGNKFLVFIYGVLINLILYLSFKRNTSFFEFFFGILLWLGFWFKFSLHVILPKLQSETYVNIIEGLSLNYINLPRYDKINILDNSLIVSCYAFVGYILASYLAKNILKEKQTLFDYKKNFSKNIQNLYIFLIIILIIFIAYFNFENQIYQRGLVSKSNLPFYINAIVKWLLLFGLASIISIFIFYNLKNRKFLYFFSFLSIFEASISNLSYLSRASIFNTFSIFFGIYKSNRIFKLNLSIKYFIIYFFFIIFFFLITSMTVNFLRSYYFNFKNSSDIKIAVNLEKKSLELRKDNVLVVDKYNNFSKALLEILSLIGNRWVGINAVISVENYENKNFALLYNSFFENYNSEALPYYERIIHKQKNNLNAISYGIKTPGIIAFLYFSGSKSFLFISIFLISICFIFFERLIYKILSNPIFCSLIMQIIAYRLVHFGYLPKQSYLLFGSIIMTILIYFILIRFFEKKINYK
jgi:hypothetical protein